MHNQGTTTMRNTEDKEPNNEAAECCCVMTACCGGFGALGATITWFIISCIALSNMSNDEIREHCPESNLWTALLTWVVIVGLSLFGSKGGAQAGKDGGLCTAFAALCIVIAIYGSLNAWLGVELYSPCSQEHLTDTQVYRLAFIWFIVIDVILGICVMTVLWVTCMMCRAVVAGDADDRSSSTDTIDRRTVAGRADDDARFASNFHPAHSNGQSNQEENV